jgi:hypothetical protein
VVAKHHLARFVQTHPGMLTGNLVIHENDLALALVAANNQSFRGNVEGAARKDSGSGD